MNKYISFLLVPIMLFGINSNSSFGVMNQNTIVQTNEDIINKIEKARDDNIVRNKRVAIFLDKLLLFFRGFDFPQIVSDNIKTCVNRLLLAIEEKRNSRDNLDTSHLNDCVSELISICNTIEDENKEGFSLVIEGLWNTANNCSDDDVIDYNSDDDNGTYNSESYDSQ